MRLIVVSSPAKFDSELKILPGLFENGLEAFHLRKPKFSSRRMNKYLNKFPKEYLNRVIIHTHHNLAIKFRLKGIHITEKQKKKKFFMLIKLKILKLLNPNLAVTTTFHSISDLLREKKKYHYVFLSPVFDSISKKNYRSSFNEEILKQTLIKAPQTVIALGGVKTQNIFKAKEFGFSGVAVLGALWAEGVSPIKVFTEIKDACIEKDLKILPLNLEV